MDCASDRHIRGIVLMLPSQSGKTESLINIKGYFTDYKPSPMLIINPTIAMSKNYYKTRWWPTIECTPRLKALIAPPRVRDSGNTQLLQNFPGGYCALIGANSAAEAASRTIRYVQADEINRYATSAEQEGSVLSLAFVRQKNFRNAFSAYASTPTLKGY